MDLRRLVRRSGPFTATGNDGVRYSVVATPFETLDSHRHLDVLVRAGDRGVAQQVLAGEARAELAVDLLQLADRRRLDVTAPRITGELLQRRKLREPRTESDREDPDVRRSRRRGCAFKGLVACAVPGGAMLLAVGEQDHRSRFDLVRLGGASASG